MATKKYLDLEGLKLFYKNLMTMIPTEDKLVGYKDTSRDWTAIDAMKRGEVFNDPKNIAFGEYSHYFGDSDNYTKKTLYGATFKEYKDKFCFIENYNTRYISAPGILILNANDNGKDMTEIYFIYSYEWVNYRDVILNLRSKPIYSNGGDIDAYITANSDNSHPIQAYFLHSGIFDSYGLCSGYDNLVFGTYGTSLGCKNSAGAYGLAVGYGCNAGPYTICFGAGNEAMYSEHNALFGSSQKHKDGKYNIFFGDNSNSDDCEKSIISLHNAEITRTFNSIILQGSTRGSAPYKGQTMNMSVQNSMHLTLQNDTSHSVDRSHIKQMIKCTKLLSVGSSPYSNDKFTVEVELDPSINAIPWNMEYIYIGLQSDCELSSYRIRIGKTYEGIFLNPIFDNINHKLTFTYLNRSGKNTHLSDINGLPINIYDHTYKISGDSHINLGYDNNINGVWKSILLGEYNDVADCSYGNIFGEYNKVFHTDYTNIRGNYNDISNVEYSYISGDRNIVNKNHNYEEEPASNLIIGRENNINQYGNNIILSSGLNLGTYDTTYIDHNIYYDPDIWISGVSFQEDYSNFDPERYLGTKVGTAKLSPGYYSVSVTADSTTTKFNLNPNRIYLIKSTNPEKPKIYHMIICSQYTFNPGVSVSIKSVELTPGDDLFFNQPNIIGAYSDFKEDIYDIYTPYIPNNWNVSSKTGGNICAPLYNSCIHKSSKNHIQGTDCEIFQSHANFIKGAKNNSLGISNCVLIGDGLYSGTHNKIRLGKFNSESWINSYAGNYYKGPSHIDNVLKHDIPYISIGNGTSEDDRSNSFAIFDNGSFQSDGTHTTPCADYAENFEWLDGNPDNEDRVGYIVSIEGEKIKLANDGDNIIGVVSATPAIVGDNPSQWHDKYLKDEWGRYIYEEYDVEYEETERVPVESTEIVNKIADETVEKNPTKPAYKEVLVKKTRKDIRRKINPAYDANQTYIDRAERKEWAAIGLLGKLLVRQDGTLKTGGFCKPVKGIATESDSGYYVMKVVSKSQALLLVK